MLLAAGLLTLPQPAPTAVAPPQERATPLLEQEVQRREQLRLFGELQELGPRLARHSVTIPAPAPEAALPSDVAPPTPRVDPAGHGLIVSADGEVITAAAALRGRETLPVEVFGGGHAEARVVAYDPDTDMVLLQAETVPRTDAAPWAIEPPPAGMLSVAVSHARGHVAVAPVFVTAAPDAERRIRTTTSELAPGTPLFTVAGEVFAIAVGTDASAVLVAPAVTRLRERIASGQARRGALGLTFQPLDEALREAFPAPGVLIADVTPRGPADDAGLQPGDVITAIGDVPVTSPDGARQTIAALPPDAGVTVRVTRGRQTLDVEVQATSALGLRVRQGARGADTDAPEARLVLDSSNLRASNLRPRSRILAIDGRDVASMEDARAQLRRARPPVVLYVEDERGRFFQVLERE